VRVPVLSPESRARLVAATTLALALLTVIAAAASVTVDAVDDLAPAPSALAAVAFAAAAAVLGVRRSGVAVALLLSLAGVLLAGADGTTSWARHSLVDDPGSLPAGAVALWLGSWLWAPGYCAIAILLPLRLPDGARPGGVWRAVWWVSVTTTALAALAWATTPYDRMDAAPLDGAAGVASPAGNAFGPVLLGATLPLVLACAVAGLVSVVLRLRTAGGEERQQLKWAALGTVLTLVILLLGHVVGPADGSELLLALGALPMALGITVAALRYRLWEVDRVIRGTLAYVLLTALVVGVYAVAVLALGSALGARTGAPLVATVVVALTAEPAHRWVRGAVDRVTRGDRSDPYQALVRLGRRLEEAAGVPAGPEALAAVAGAVQRALDAPWVRIEVVDGPAASSGPVHGSGHAVPLTHGGEAVGRLVIGLHRADRALSAGEQRLLADLTTPVAAAADAVRLRAALQSSRERLVTAREEERRRLRHDLHDDLGPVLAAVALQIGEVRSQIGDAHPAAPLTTRAESLLTGAVASVRRIVDGLRPEALDDLGLEHALRATVDGFDGADLRVEAHLRGDLGDLPAAVEVAALRIATEALSNAARHAGAAQVRVALERLDDRLEVSVADDGRGLPQSRTGRGVGLVSMRERAEELGGTLRIRSSDGGGTLVTASLPTPATAPVATPATDHRSADQPDDDGKVSL
jgi:signal transduction histidine kinase